MYRKASALSSLGAIAFIATGCSGQTALSNETFGTAVREVGLTCEMVVHSAPLNEENTSWRVFCDQAQTYLASVKADGHLCIEPLYIGDGIGPVGAGFILPKARCTS